MLDVVRLVCKPLLSVSGIMMMSDVLIQPQPLVQKQNAKPNQAKAKVVGLSEIDHTLLHPQLTIGAIIPKTAYHAHLNPESVKLFTELGNSSTSKERVAEIKTKLQAMHPHQLLKMVDGQPITWIPALLKVFDEILVNAADQARRTAEHTTNRMQKLDVVVDVHSTRISVSNDGDCIDLSYDETEKLYNPQKALGQNRCSTNFDKNVNQTVGGTHGLGAKGTNIWSREMGIIVDDYNTSHQHFEVKWSNNMRVMSEPSIKPFKIPLTIDGDETATKKQKHDSTTVWFVPDLEKFKAPDNAFTENQLSLMYRRVISVAATLASLNITVTLNGFKIPAIKSLKEFAFLHLTPLKPLENTQDVSENDGADTIQQKNDDGITEEDDDDIPLTQALAAHGAAAAAAATAGCKEKKRKPVKTLNKNDFQPIVHLTPNDRWEIVITNSPTGKFVCHGFVNNVESSLGEHISHVMEYITSAAHDLLPKKVSDDQSKRAGTNQIKNQFMIFVNCLIVNPVFDGQIKEKLNTKPSDFGSKCGLKLEEDILPMLKKLDIKKRLMGLYVERVEQKHDEADGVICKGRRVIADKLCDANLAGSNELEDTVLIITEGNSADALVTAALAINKKVWIPQLNKYITFDRDHIGTFASKGKVKNVTNTCNADVLDNTEIKTIGRALGLRRSDKDDTGRRYGHLMFMADQDSVTGDTPLLLRDEKGSLSIQPIESIFNCHHLAENGREYGTADFEVWSERGWTKIENVMRHKTSKRIFRVLSHTGVVDVTEDHSLLRPDGTTVPPSKCAVNEQLLHSFPAFDENRFTPPPNWRTLTRLELYEMAQKLRITGCQALRRDELISQLANVFKQESFPITPTEHIDIREAYVMGLFWADGTAAVYEFKQVRKPKDRPNEYTFNRVGYSWNISNTNMAFLQKAKAYLCELYPEYPFVMDPDRNSLKLGNKLLYKLQLRGGKLSQALIHKYRSLFYSDDREKVIPPCVLNASTAVRQAFFDGYYDGDGCKYSLNKSGSRFFDVKGKSGAHALFLLCRSLGYQVSVNHNPKKPLVYVLTLTTGYQQDSPSRIKKIIDLGITEGFVYDLETSNHHFQAGIGQMIVHNTDGLHIKGLWLAAFKRLWPFLLQKTHFFIDFNTFVLVASHSKNKVERGFFSDIDADQFEQETSEETGWVSKYYKGLGTSSNAEGKAYFRNAAKHIFAMKYGGPECLDALDIAFNTKRSDEKRALVEAYNKNPVGFDYTTFERTYQEFVKRELVRYWDATDKTKMASAIDGNKPVQRKLIHSCYENGFIGPREVNVATLAGSIKEFGYHHGEASAAGAAIVLAQYSNNYSVFNASGQFGSILRNGKDHAAPRYLNTSLSPFAMAVYPKKLVNILKKTYENRKFNEPEAYAPVLSTLLINGAFGIGSTRKCKVLKYNPRDIATWTLFLLHCIEQNGDITIDTDLETQRPQPLFPWYRGFKGEIRHGKTKHSYIMFGRIGKLTATTYAISAIPLGKSIIQYKKKLTTMLNTSLIQEFKEYHTVDVYFHITMTPAQVVIAEKAGWYEHFDLVSSLMSDKMWLLNAEKVLQKFESAEEILQYQIPYTLQCYQTLHESLLGDLNKDLSKVESKIKFVDAVIKGDIKLAEVPLAITIQQLEEQKYPRFEISHSGYGYLVSMPLHSLNTDTVDALQAERDSIDNKIKDQEKESKFTMWRKDITKCLDVVEAWDLSQESLAAADKDDDDGDGFADPDDDGTKKKNKRKRGNKKTSKAALAAAAQKSQMSRDYGEIISPSIAKDCSPTEIDDDDSIEENILKVDADSDSPSKKDIIVEPQITSTPKARKTSKTSKTSDPSASVEKPTKKQLKRKIDDDEIHIKDRSEFHITKKGRKAKAKA